MPTVVATKKGHYLCERYPGDEFDVPEGMTGSWFEAPAAAKAKLKAAEARANGKKPQEPKTFSEMAKTGNLG